VGRKTSSEAVINAVDFMKYAGVVVVGEESGGRPNHFGEVRRFVLPESGLIVSHSTRYFALMEEDLPAISPDIDAPETYEQYIEGVDPALEAVRNHELP
jgi:C-terminal processing protease CtpA/Prc